MLFFNIIYLIKKNYKQIIFNFTTELCVYLKNYPVGLGFLQRSIFGKLVEL